jgi:hypothetical protein
MEIEFDSFRRIPRRQSWICGFIFIFFEETYTKYFTGKNNFHKVELSILKNKNKPSEINIQK